jgi:hypothetical protein
MSDQETRTAVTSVLERIATSCRTGHPGEMALSAVRPFTACSITCDPCFTNAACPPVGGKAQVCTQNIICP